MIRNKISLNRGSEVCLISRAIGAGRSNTISISNTKKITARRKNRMENGSRALFLGSNPHSKGEDFSRSMWARVARKNIAITIRRVRRIESKLERRVISIVQNLQTKQLI